MFATVSGMMTLDYSEVYPAYSLIGFSGVTIALVTNLSYEWEGAIWLISFSVISTFAVTTRM
jgi:hypothetical protein